MAARRRRGSPPPGPLTPDEEARLLRRLEASPRLQAAALLVLDAGLRPAEVVRLRAGDVVPDGESPGVWVRSPRGYAWLAAVSRRAAEAVARLIPPGADPARLVFGWRSRQALSAALRRAGVPTARLRATFVARLMAGGAMGEAQAARTAACAPGEG